MKKTHDHCPRDPGTPSHGEPVFVGEFGIYCHKCASTGRGFTPYAALVPGGKPAKPNALRAAVRNFCHWPHAKHVVRRH